MLNHTKHVRPTSSCSSRSIPNCLEVLTPQPNDDTYLYHSKQSVNELLPLRSQSSLSHYPHEPSMTLSTSSIHNYSHTSSHNSSVNSSSFYIKSKSNSSHIYPHNSNLSGSNNTLTKLSKDICDLKIEEIKTRVSNHRLKNALNNMNNNNSNNSHEHDANSMETLSKELDKDYSISSSTTAKTFISPHNRYKSYLKESINGKYPTEKKNKNDPHSNNNTNSNIIKNNNNILKSNSINKLKSNILTENNNKEKTEKENLFSDLKPTDYDDPSLFYLEQFLLKIMDKNYKEALPLARQVLEHDPLNSICKDYIKVLQQKIEQDEKNEEEDDDESSDEDDNGSDSDDDSDSDEEDSDEESDEDDEGDDSDEDEEDSDEDTDEEDEEEEEEEEEE